jgi:hypothetical protein
LAWLLRHAKELGRIARWILRLAPFKFRVSHISGKANVVADCITRQYEQPIEGAAFTGLVLGQLPEAIRSIPDHQKKDPFCREIYRRLAEGDPGVRQFKLMNGAVVYQSHRSRPKRYLLPEALIPMVLEYFQFPLECQFRGRQNLESPHEGVLLARYEEGGVHLRDEVPRVSAS